MRLDTFIARQLRKPSGLIGRLFVGKSLNKSNGPLEDMGLELMDLKPGYHVLEIGFGNGRLISKMAPRLHEGTITGIDISDVMIEQARKRNQDFIQSGKVKLLKASVEDIPAEDEYFDRIFTANTIYFWPDPGSDIGEVFRTLKTGGCFYCGMRVREDMLRLGPILKNRDIFKNLYTLDEITAFFKSAGFSQVDYYVKQRKQFADVIVVGQK